MNQDKRTYIEQLAEQYHTQAVRMNRNNYEAVQTIINKVKAIALNESPLDTETLNQIISHHFYPVSRLVDALLQVPQHWSLEDNLIKGLLTENYLLYEERNRHVWQYIAATVTLESGDKPQRLINHLRKMGVSDKDLITKMILFSGNPFYTNTFRYGESNIDGKLSEFSKYILPKLKGTRNFLGIQKKTGQDRLINDLLLEHKRGISKFAGLKFLYENAPAVLEGHYLKYMIDDSHHRTMLNQVSVIYLLRQDPEKFEPILLQALQKFTADITTQYFIYHLLNETFNGKYHHELCQIGEKSLNKYYQAPYIKGQYYNDDYTNGGTMPIVFSEYLLKYNRKAGKERILDYLKNSSFIGLNYLEFIEKNFDKEALLLLMSAVHKDARIVGQSRYQNYHQQLFKLLEKYDLSPYLAEICDYALTKTAKKMRYYATTALAKYIDKVEERALALVKGKTVDERMVGAMILQHSKDPAIQKVLSDLVDLERNDETRDILLETLQSDDKTANYSHTKVLEMINYAEKRKKLSRWSEKWLEEASLPKLYWQEDGTTLNQAQIRFLFYRSKRAKGLNSDMEARQMVQQLDAQKSNKFASFLLKAFQDSNMDTKYKYYLTIAGMMGDDSILAKLHTLFRKTITDKRYKMSEYMLAPVMMVGSNKALRLIDMIVRKYASKKPRIAQAAKEALSAAAVELNITADQLSDRIIPNFDFVEHYKHFEVDGEPYRAFVGKNFKLQYFNQDNKLRKSIPKGTPKEVVADLKAIGKEITGVVKLQKDRLESYLINERKWTVAEWEAYYFQNPIMLIYVQRLIWGLYKDGQLMHTFYCDEDLEFYDVEDEEVMLSEGSHIGIIHPLQLTETQIAQWKEKLYELEIDLEFPIFNREITLIPESEIESHTSKILMNTDIPKGADYVAGFLEKRGWIKETGDGGRLNFYKKHAHIDIKVAPFIDGPAAYYQGGTTKATIYEIYLQGKSWSEKLKFSEAPQVFISEAIADLKALANA